MTAKSDGDALHDILLAVREAKVNTIRDAWASVLDAPAYSSEFFRRFGEVTRLLTGLTVQIEALEGKSKDIFMRHLSSWWTMLIQQERTWNSAVQLGEVFPLEQLDQLNSAAEIAAMRSSGTVKSPDGSSLDGLQAQAQFWVANIDTYSEIPLALRQSLKKDFEHILWLIENSNLFGVARPAEEAQAAMGGLAMAAQYVTQPEHRKTFKQHLKDLTAVLAMLAALLEGGQLALESAQDFGETVVKVTRVFEESQEPVAPKELGSAPSITNGSDQSQESV